MSTTSSVIQRSIRPIIVQQDMQQIIRQVKPNYDQVYDSTKRLVDIGAIQPHQNPEIVLSCLLRRSASSKRHERNPFNFEDTKFEI